jgi:hypothetical protein
MNEVEKMFEEKDKERVEAIKKIKNSKMAEWEKKMALRAVKSSTFGWL